MRALLVTVIAICCVGCGSTPSEAATVEEVEEVDAVDPVATVAPTSEPATVAPVPTPTAEPEPDPRGEQPIDVSRVVTAGHSAGGHLGLLALGQQTDVEVQGSVGLGAVVDLAYFFQPEGLLGGNADGVPLVYADAAPVLDAERVILIQGGADGIVPIDSLQPARDAGVRIVVVEGDDHFALINPASDSWAATITAIEELLAS